MYLHFHERLELTWHSKEVLVNGGQWRSQLDNWGGDIFIYSCSALLISFEIDCFYGL